MLIFVSYTINKSDLNESIPIGQSIPDQDKESKDEVQKRTAHLLPLLSAALLIPGLLSSFTISSLSDHYGRRVAMGVLFGGLTSNIIVSSLVILLELNLYLLILGNLTCGFLGGGLLTFSGQISVCFADITKIPDEQAPLLDNSKCQQASLERRRLSYMGIYDGVCVLASAAVASVTGVLIDHYGFITTCLIMLFLCLISVGMLWCLPETQSFNVQTADISSFDNNFSNGVSACNMGFYSSNQSEPHKKNWLLKSTEMINLVRSANIITVLVLTVLFLTTLTTYNEGQYTFLYLMGPPFNWSVDQYGYYSGLNSTLLGLFSFGLTWVTTRWMKVVKRRRMSEASEPLLTNQSVSSYNSIHEVDSIDYNNNSNISSPSNLIIQNEVLRARRRMINIIATVNRNVISTNSEYIESLLRLTNATSQQAYD
ncbi:putative adenylate cyclase [Schistosoma mansoni]|uniref:putative adenylate cyclase n=1 Tax=Schistosoma mansoni TaxID=6183 RepID=UPI00019B387B|nr:putative adenylate cyclase [Schistosoma mansoni]|eukprot:XP_018654830.1 putative adenylate cyclase [Schistosoma mansoni]